MTTPTPHVPVLRDRVVELLTAAPDGVIVDCTLGAGGHARAILEARAGRPANRLIGIDRDEDILALAGDNLAGMPGEHDLVHARFDEIEDVLDARDIDRISGVLYDLGVSSLQLDRAGRGFSYHDEGPLDMRMDRSAAVTAAELVNTTSKRDLADLIARYSGERFARRIAEAIVASRPLETTAQLADVVASAVPAATRGRRHPARRTFQALRIAVNDEFSAIERSLPVALERLRPDGIAVVLAYHSLEDRIVHRILGDAARGCICPPDLPVCGCGRTPLVALLTSRPERPDDTEIATNRRARAALLRAARRLPDPT